MDNQEEEEEQLGKLSKGEAGETGVNWRREGGTVIDLEWHHRRKRMTWRQAEGEVGGTSIRGETEESR